VQSRMQSISQLIAVVVWRRLPEKALEEFDYYMDTHKLRITVSNMKNANTQAQLLSMRDHIIQNLSSLPHVPSVPFAEVPPPHSTVRAESCPGALPFENKPLCPSLYQPCQN
jgi:hypothetical protein